MIPILKGIDITLYYENGTQTVSNVLIGEPQTVSFCDTTVPAYILAIPKGDAHIWTDRVVEFFGQKFRTVGYPERGIEDMMPLQWHQKVRVQLLLTNCAVSIFEAETFTAHVSPEAYSYRICGERADKVGTRTAGEQTVYLYTPDYQPKIGDIVVVGDCDFTFDTTSQQTVSQSMAAFRKAYPHHTVIRDVKRITCGTIPDFEVVARCL